MGDRLTYEEYKETANMMTEGKNTLWVRVEYDFAVNLQVGDRVFLSDEESNIWSPFIHTIEFGEMEDCFRIEYEVVRRDFTANGLWVIIEENE